MDWVYLSPLLQAEAGSDHGYDVCATTGSTPRAAVPRGWPRCRREARRLGMGVLVDIVPNHVGVATPTAGTWWWDLLQHGRGSAYASHFDVDWAAGGGRVLVPVVGDDDVLDGGGIGHLEVRGRGRRPGCPTTTTASPSLPARRARGRPDAVHDRQHYELVNWRDADEG